MTHSLSDAELEDRWVNLTFGLINLALLFSLLTIGTSLAIMAFAPSNMTHGLTNDTGSLAPSSRAIFLVGAICSLGAVRLLGKRLEDVWRWSRLHASGTLTVDELGITISHDAVLATGAFLPWESISAIAFDTGINHDTLAHWRRFPVLPRTTRREFLFATDGNPVPQSTLIASRPTPPNMVIVLNDSIVLHNPHIDATDAAFPLEATKGMPSRPPRERSEVRIVFLRATRPAEIRGTVSVSGKVRPIRKSDLPGLFLDRITTIGN